MLIDASNDVLATTTLSGERVRRRPDTAKIRGGVRAGIRGRGLVRAASGDDVATTA